ncbi:fluoride efflux transporter CrcB [Brevundimonas sp.]|uniref:fluoride efflux transporter CrcB n=1 Tax=unclassified Brevundimonas TaxID=2622653 RepID=UPI003AFFC04E
MNFLIVFLGAGLGGALRHAVNIVAGRAGGLDFPYGTLSVNVVGSLLMGLVAGFFALRGEASQHIRLFLTTGLLGGFTTFSAFSLETLLLCERGRLGAAVGYAIVSVVASVLALGIGLVIARRLL